MSDDEEFRRGLEAIFAEYRQSLGKRLAELGALARDLANGAALPGRMSDLRRGLHSLAGTGRTFGLPEVSHKAAAAESFLEPFCAAGTLPHPDEWAEFGQLFEALQQAAAGR